MSPTRRRPDPRTQRATVGAVYAASSMASALLLPPARAAALVSAAWAAHVAAGCVAAVSKFGAPSLTRAVGVDVGRHQFAAGNAAELGLAAGLVAALARGGAGTAAPWRLAPVPPLLVLAADVAVLTPALDARARHVIAVEGDGEREDGARTRPPPAWLHTLYVAGEAVKVGCLLGVAAGAPH